MDLDRGWMYNNRLQNGSLTTEFLEVIENFLDFALSKPSFMVGDNIRCPCHKCKHKHFHAPQIVRAHLAKKGFVPNYHTWVFHGEVRQRETLMETEGSRSHRLEEMIFDAGNSFHFNMNEPQEEAPNPEAQQLYDMLSAADKELWPGCVNHTQLSLIARLISLKSENTLSERCYDEIVELIGEIVPENNSVPKNFYETKKMLRGLGLPVEIIDCCRNNCMLFWRNDEHLIECKFCGAARFKDINTRSKKGSKVPESKMYYFPITPRLQRLYASKATASQMRWHATSVDDGIMRHPADSPAWKHLNSTFPDFASEIRNVRLGLSADGFQPFGQTGKQYTSWPVIITPYNLPPWLCMKEQHMFLTVVIPGPHNPRDMIDVFLQPLIAELIDLWNVGVSTYDVSVKQNFQMRAALLWTISDKLHARMP